ALDALNGAGEGHVRMNRRSGSRAPMAKRPNRTNVKRRVAAPTETNEQQPHSQAGFIGELQTAAGNRAVSRQIAGGETVQRKEVTIKGELVEINSIFGFVTTRGEIERKEAEEILTTIKHTYGIDVSSSKL